MKKPNQKRVLPILLMRLGFLVLMGFGLFLLYFQTAEARMAQQSKSWPTTTGILKIQADEYRKTISYRYEVGGVVYTSDRVIFGELGNRHPSYAWHSVSQLPDGKEISIFYQPGNPGVSTLMTETREGGAVIWLLGSAFLLGGIFGFLISRRAELQG